MKKINLSRKTFAAILIVIFAAAASIGYIYAAKRTPPLKAEEYRVGDDSVKSITSFLEKDKKLKEITEPQDGGGEEISYVYKRTQIKDEEVAEYTSYLTDELNYVSMGSKEGGEPLIYVIESADEGMMFKIRMETVDKDYIITVSKEEGEVPRPKEVKKEFTRDDAYMKFEEFADANDMLPQPVENYMDIFDIGQVEINGEICYGINLYEKGVSGTNEIAAKYYIALESENIYKYDIETGEISPVSKK
ncbi:hypothetical protein NE664_08130 [Anaerotignum faecicola]|nr:hypothetical protein [Anaerotignum faecicola]